MTTRHGIEIICLSSDDIPQSPSDLNLTEQQGIENVRRSDGGTSRNGKGKEVQRDRFVSPGQDLFEELDLSVNRDASEAPLRVWRKGLTEAMRMGGEDPISSWSGHSQNVIGLTPPKTSRWQIEEDDEVIVIDNSPAKPLGRSFPSPVGPFTTRDGGFSTTTTSVIADILGSETSSGDELGEIDGLLGYESRRQTSNGPSLSHTQFSSKRRRSTGGDDDIRDSDGPFNTKTKKKRITRDESQLDRLPGSPARKRWVKLTEDERERRAEEKARKAAQREAEKEAKRAEKEAKALEKQKELELDTVNKLKASRKDSVKEIIVDISDSFAQSLSGQQLLRFLETQQCESTVDWNPPVPNVIKWRRKIVADWDEELGHFIPVSERIKEEKHILVVVKADDFVDMTVGETDLDEHVNKIKALLGTDGIKPIYVIEGLTALLRKSRNSRNRTFQGAVRQAMEGSMEGNSGVFKAATTRVRKGPKVIDEDMVEDTLLSLQITHGCLVHHTISMQETSEWISQFTGDISTIPYKLSRMNHDISFCADAGQVRTGGDVEDIYFKMLQEITRVTAGVASGIMGEYKSVRELMNAFRDEGEVVIADLEIMARKTGIPSGRKIGQAVSKRLYQFFTRQDPDCEV